MSDSQKLVDREISKFLNDCIFLLSYEGERACIYSEYNGRAWRKSADLLELVTEDANDTSFELDDLKTYRNSFARCLQVIDEAIERREISQPA